VAGCARFALFDEIFATPAPAATAAPVTLSPSNTVAIIYTSGTSGEAKGVMLTVATSTTCCRAPPRVSIN